MRQSPILSFYCLSKWFKKSIAFLLILTQLITGQTRPAIAVEPSDADNASVEMPAVNQTFRIPSNLGKVEKIFQGKTPLKIILIQDAHAASSAQKNIAKILRFLEKRYEKPRVLVEGASGSLDPLLLKAFPDQGLLRKILKPYADHGEIPGSVLAALQPKSRAAYRGIEDWTLYQEGVALYRSAMQKSPELLESLQAEEKTLERTKEKIYSPELRAADQIIRDFQDNKIDLLEFLKSLSRIQRPNPDSPVAAFLQGIETSGDEKIEQEVAALAKKVRLLLRERQKAKFNQKYQEFKTSRITAGEFALYLSDVIASPRRGEAIWV